MDINFSSNIGSQLSGLTNRDIERATEQALDRCAQIVLNEKARKVNETYARPIPRRRNGRPKWTRSGAFQRDQTIQKKIGERVIGAVGPSANYEGRLANLPVSKDGVNRRNAAAQNALRVVEPQIARVFEQEIKNALGL